MKSKTSSDRSGERPTILWKKQGEAKEMDALLDSANESAKLVRTVFLFFMLISLYISILVGSTTHKQLFLASAVPLPFMQVSLPVVGIYIVAPWIYFFLHFNLLQLLFVHSEKLHSLKKVACDDWEKKKTLLYPIFFFQLADQYAPKQFNPIHLHHFCLHHHGCSPPCAVVVDSGSILALSQRNHCKRRTNPRVPIVFSICDPDPRFPTSRSRIWIRKQWMGKD